MFLPLENVAFGNNREKEQKMPRPEFKRYVSYIFADNICSACSPMQMVVFCKNVVIL